MWGSTVAAPVFREVALQTARILNIAPDKIPPQPKTVKTIKKKQPEATNTKSAKNVKKQNS